MLVLIDDHLAAEKKRSEQLEQEPKTLERTAEVQVAQRRLDVELKERRSEIYKSLLERELRRGVHRVLADVAAHCHRIPDSGHRGDAVRCVSGSLLMRRGPGCCFMIQTQKKHVPAKHRHR